MLSRHLTLTAVLVSAALLLPACAGSGGDAGNQASAAPATPAAAAAPASPATPAAAPAAGEPATVASTDRSNEVVCKKYTITGSRIAARTVCKTRREWVENAQHMKNAMRAAERRSAGAGAPASMGGG